jgi:MFS family permease
MEKETLEIPSKLISNLRIAVVFTSFFVISVIMIVIVNLSVAIFSLQENLSVVVSSVINLFISLLAIFSLIIFFKINNYIEKKEIDKISSYYYIIISGITLLIYNLFVLSSSIVLFLSNLGFEIITAIIIYGLFGIFAGIFQILTYSQLNSFLMYYKTIYGEI